MEIKKRYTVEDYDELDDFASDWAYIEYGENYSVTVMSSGAEYFPVYYIRENGDVDGLMGWR